MLLCLLSQATYRHLYMVCASVILLVNDFKKVPLVRRQPVGWCRKRVTQTENSREHNHVGEKTLVGDSSLPGNNTALIHVIFSLT